LTWKNVTAYFEVPIASKNRKENTDEYEVVLKIWTNLFERINYRPTYLWTAQSDNRSIDINPQMVPNRINGVLTAAAQQLAPGYAAESVSGVGDAGAAAAPAAAAAADAVPGQQMIAFDRRRVRSNRVTPSAMMTPVWIGTL
jgi:hypothetical protein